MPLDNVLDIFTLFRVESFEIKGYVLSEDVIQHFENKLKIIIIQVYIRLIPIYIIFI